jgi:hypothetical protein
LLLQQTDNEEQVIDFVLLSDTFCELRYIV